MSERWTCVMTKRLTVTQEAEINELLLAHFDDLCVETISTRNEEERRAPLTPLHERSIHSGKKQFTKAGSKKAQVGNSSMEMSWGGMEKREEGIL